MKIKCEYCRANIEDTDEKCPYCGADNKHLKRVSDETPKTIEELKQWYIDHNLPPEDVTRFFIGKNYKKPRAFGIYKDEGSGNFVVYKNKSDGQRAIRYEGKDEVYAVNELYIKLKEEIINQKRNSLKGKPKSNPYTLSLGKLCAIIAATCVIITMFCVILIGTLSPTRGYYKYNDKYYYYQTGSWYLYENEHWRYTTAPDELKDHHSSYYSSTSYSSDYDIIDFKYSSYYKEDTTRSSSSSSDRSWDSSSSWDSGSSWDSSSTDFSSDW